MKIENMKLVDNAGALVARFDVVGQSLTIKRMGIFSKADGSMWISEPADKFTTRDGSISWSKHVIITDDALKTEIERLAKEAYHELCCTDAGQPGNGEPF